MELRVLTYFLMVAREENITKASQLLNVTQPTLSRQLMQLEDELGVKLFIRGSHKVTLTEDGLLLKRRAQDIVSLADKTIREFQAEKDDLNGEITIGSGELLGMDYFIKIISEFQKEYPNVRYSIRTGTADDIKERIESGLIDIGILTSPGDISKYKSVLLPEHEIYGALVQNNSELASKEYIVPQDLINKSLFIPNRTITANSFEQWAGSFYDKMKIIGTFNLTYNVASMVRNNMGIALGIKLNWEIEGVTFVPFYTQIPSNTYFAWKKNETLSPTTSAFINFAQEYLKAE